METTGSTDSILTRIGITLKYYVSPSRYRQPPGSHRMNTDQGLGHDYRVELSTYSGPLDLLLFLVRRNEIDLQDIPIAQLTQQYLQHLDLIRQFDPQRVGEFLVMAATLLEIKSAMLAPTAQGSDEPIADDAPFDPRHELVTQLLAYKRFKDAAGELEHRRSLWQDRFPRLPAKSPTQTPSHDDSDDSAPPVGVDLDDANVLDLCHAFVRILESVGTRPGPHQVVADDTPIAVHAQNIVDRLSSNGPMMLHDIFAEETNRSRMIGLFLATLELVRRGELDVDQDPESGKIRLNLLSRDPKNQQKYAETASVMQNSRGV